MEVSVSSENNANLSDVIGWVYPYLSVYAEANGVKFLDGSPEANEGQTEGVECIDPFALFHPEADVGAPVRDWVGFHMRTLLGVMGPPFDAVLRIDATPGARGPELGEISGRYVVLAAASDALDEMVYMIGRITQDGSALLFLSEVPLLIKAMDQTAGKQLHAVTRWMAGIPGRAPVRRASRNGG